MLIRQLRALEKKLALAGDKALLVVGRACVKGKRAQAADAALAAAVAVAQRIAVGVDAGIAARLQQARVVGQRAVAADLQALLAHQRAAAVIEPLGGQLRIAAARQHPLAVIQFAAAQRQRAGAEYAAAVAAQLVAQARAVCIEQQIATRLQQSAVVIQRAAVAAQCASGGDYAVLVIQRVLAQRQRKVIAEQLAALILQPGGIEGKVLLRFKASSLIRQRLLRRNAAAARRRRHLALAVVQPLGV